MSIKPVDTMIRESLRKLVSKTRNEAITIDKGYCEMRKAIDQLNNMANSVSFTSGALPVLIEDLTETNDTGNIIEICDEIEFCIDESIIKGEDLLNAEECLEVAEIKEWNTH